MKTAALLAAAALVLAVPQACPSSAERGTSDGVGVVDPTAWDGTDLKICGVPPTPPPGRTFATRKGYLHILAIVTADTVTVIGGREKCIPNISISFTMRLDGSLNGRPALKPDRGQPLPWTGRLVTPHFEHLFVPLAAGGQGWEVAVRAARESLNQPPRGSISRIRCAIFVDNRRVRDDSVVLAQGAATASCFAGGTVPRR
jgi:hypothetical protein